MPCSTTSCWDWTGASPWCTCPRAGPLAARPEWEILPCPPGTVAYVHGRSWAGVRLQLNSILLTTGGDVTEVALVPEGRFDLGVGYLHGRLVVNLDTPYGFAFDTGRIWGLFPGAGIYL